MPSTPINIALTGLSQSAKTNWASQGHLPYLLSPHGKAHYRIAALLNSSEEAARKAIAFYNLDPSTKAYGSPAALAADPDIDLVVVTTRVDNHYSNILPSLQAGRMAFVEWPLAENAQKAAELAAVAREKGVRTMVGLQGRVAPAVMKVREVLESGVVGKVLSSEVKAFSPFSGRREISEGLAYFNDKQIGGNLATIAFGHMLDFVHTVLGEFATANWHSQIQRPSQQIIHPDTSSTPSTTDVPDLISVHGTLPASPLITPNASLLLSFRKGPPFPGTLPFTWTIEGEKGEIRVSSTRGPFLQSEAHALPVPIQVHDFATGEVREVAWEWEEWQEGVEPVRGRSIAMLYFLFAEGREKEAGVADFEGALLRHRELDGWLYG